jgi:DUF4097 and DUF4098 domain-containing protein YvlB
MRITGRFAALWVAMLCLLAFTSQAAFAGEKAFDKKFPATPGGTLTVDTDMGSIFVSGSEGHDVVIHAVLSGADSQLKNFEIGAEPDSHGVAVHGKRYNDWWLDLSWLFGGGARAKFEIQVPREYHIELHTAGGAIEAQNIKGNVHGGTSGGHLRLTSITGMVDVRTSGGSINAQQLSGNALLRTSGGNITIADVTGELDVHTSGGSVSLENIDGAVQAHTSGGSMELGLRGGNHGATLSTSGGSIKIAVPKDFKAAVDARTSGGGVHCDLPIASRGGDDHRGKNELYGDINGGGPLLSAHTAGGSIWIKVRE